MAETSNSWPDATIAGFRAMGASRYAEAAGHWLGARAALPAARLDPRLAAAHTNAGAAHILIRQPREAEAALADAERSWMALLDNVATSEVALAGRSSSFHFRLASRNLQAFQDAERRRYARQCEAGLAITRFNRMLIGAGPPAGDTAPALASLLADIFGPRSAEVRLLSATETTDTPYADKAADLSVSPASSQPTDDLSNLELAVTLTALLRPGLKLGVQSAAL